MFKDDYMYELDDSIWDLDIDFLPEASTSREIKIKNYLIEEEKEDEDITIMSCCIDHPSIRPCASVLSDKTQLELQADHDKEAVSPLLIASDFSDKISKMSIIPEEKAPDSSISLLASTQKEEDNSNLTIGTQTELGKLLLKLLKEAFVTSSEGIRFVNLIQKNCNNAESNKFYLSLEALDSSFKSLGSMESLEFSEKSLIYHNLQKNLFEFILKGIPKQQGEKEFSEKWKQFASTEELGKYLLSDFFKNKFVKVSTVKIAKLEESVLEDKTKAFLSHSLVPVNFFDELVKIFLREAKIMIPRTFGASVEILLLKDLYEKRETIFNSSFHIEFEALLKRSILKAHLPKVLWMLIRKDELDPLVMNLASKKFKTLRKTETKTPKPRGKKNLDLNVAHETEYGDFIVKKVKK